MSDSTPDTPTSVGQQLALRRQELDLTQDALARLIGITAASVSAAERGKAAISVSKRPNWERALRLQPGTLSRAYRTGRAELRPLASPAPEQPYADLSDPYERAVWERDSLSDADKRDLIDMLRAARWAEREGRQH